MDDSSTTPTGPVPARPGAVDAGARSCVSGREPDGSTGAGTAPAAQSSPAPDVAEPPERLPTRRAALRSLFVAGPVLGVAAALTPLALARRGDGEVREVEAPGTGDGRPAVGELLFDERFRGRQVRATALPDGSAAVTVDGRQLHLMRRADGSWLSMVDHYESYPTPRAAARAAVVELGTARLV